MKVLSYTILQFDLKTLCSCSMYRKSQIRLDLWYSVKTMTKKHHPCPQKVKVTSGCQQTCDNVNVNINCNNLMASSKLIIDIIAAIPGHCVWFHNFYQPLTFCHSLAVLLFKYCDMWPDLRKGTFFIHKILPIFWTLELHNFLFIACNYLNFS